VQIFFALLLQEFWLRQIRELYHQPFHPFHCRLRYRISHQHQNFCYTKRIYGCRRRNRTSKEQLAPNKNFWNAKAIIWNLSRCSPSPRQEDVAAKFHHPTLFCLSLPQHFCCCFDGTKLQQKNLFCKYFNNFLVFLINS
jgi:hypothetical protein